MKIDFSELKEMTINNYMGGDGALIARIAKDPEGRGKVLMGRLEPGSALGLHTHDTSFEVIYIVSGTATCLYDDDEPEILTAGTCTICPQGHKHALRNESDEDVSFFAVVPEL